MEHVAHFFQGHRLVGQNVTLANAALVHGGDGARCQVPDITEIEAALHSHGHLAFDDLQEGPGGLAQGVVVGAEDAAGMDYAGLQTHDPNRVQHHLGGLGFGLGISAHHLGGVAGVEFVHFLDLGAVGQLRDGPSGADVDHFFTLRMGQNLADDVSGAGDIDGHQLITVFGVHSDHAGAVDDDAAFPLGNGEEGLQGGLVSQVSQNHLHLGGDVFDGRVVGQHQGPDLAALLQQLGTDVAAEESGSSGDQIDTVIIHG